MRDARIDLRLPHAQKTRWIEHADKRALDLSELIRRNMEKQMAADEKKQPKTPVG